MRQSFKRISALPLLIPSLLLACSLTIPTASSPAPGAEPQYRYDEIPGRAEESSTITEYRAISKWDKLEVSYYFANGTYKLEGDTERELVRRAFALWAEQTPLTFTKAASSSADIVIAWAVGDHGDGDTFDAPAFCS